jgi:hypothetical protein
MTRLWTDHAYLDLEEIKETDLADIARVTRPGWSDDRPNTAMLHLGPHGTGISIIATLAQLHHLLDTANHALSTGPPGASA